MRALPVQHAERDRLHLWQVCSIGTAASTACAMWLLRMLLFFDVMLFEAAQVVIEKRQRARKRWSVLKTKLIVSIRFRKLTGYANQKATEHAEEVKTIRKQTRQAISQYKKRTIQKGGGGCERVLGVCSRTGQIYTWAALGLVSIMAFGSWPTVR